MTTQPPAREKAESFSRSIDVRSPDDNLKVQLGWRDLKLVVQDRVDGTDKTILHGLTGSISWGKMMMVIGPSGSGKTSFLNCIGNRAIGKISGNILFNGRPRPANSKRFVSIVPQDDIFFNSLTVRESLKFAADLKLPKSISHQDRLERVEQVIDELDLGRCADTTIGEIGSGISGGERRRLAIGLEIIHQPAVLLLDEPTTGLDSASALLVGRILRRLCDHQGVTVIATIHQPRLGLAKMFDRLYFLASGQEMFQGPVDPDLMPFLKSAGYTPPKLENPLDFVLDLVNTADVEGGMLETRDAAMKKLNTCYRESMYFENAKDQSLPGDFDTDRFFNELAGQPFYITPFYNQFWVIMKRSFLFKLREPISFMTQLFNAVFMSVVFGSIFWKIDLSWQGSLDRVSGISLIIIMQSFVTFDILMLFPMERELLNREEDAGLYGTLSYFLGRTMAEFPVHSMMGVLAAVITYNMLGLQDNQDKFWIYLACVVLCVNVGASALMFFSALAKTMEVSNMYATLFVMVFMLFDGNWISLDKIPVYYKWIRHISFIGYAANTAVANEYRGLVFTCTQGDAEKGVCVAGRTVTGESILGQRGLEHVNIRFNLIMLAVLTVGFRFLAYIALVFLFRSKPAKEIARSYCSAVEVEDFSWSHEDSSD